VALHLDMVVDVDPGLFPLRILIRGRRQGKEGGFVNGFEEVLSCGIEFLELAGVEVGEFLGDARVELRQGEEGVISESGQDPSFGDKDRRFRLSFILGMS
jgi:hypothetical protein